MQQQQNSRSRLTTILILYLGLWLGLQYFLPKPPPPQAQTQGLLEQAKTLEAQGRDRKLESADQVKKLEEAVKKYEEYYSANKTTPEGMQARFNEINIYDYLANRRGKNSDPHWYEQATTRLKEMETAFLGKRGKVTLEVEGQTRTEEGDLGRIATARLDQIRAAHDQANHKKWTWLVLDFFVGLTGRKPDYSYFLALALVVIILKALTFPFQRQQYKYQQDMMRVQPLIKEVQEKYKNRPPDEMQKRVFEVYKENNVSLAGGCLPMLVMMFVLFPVFWMVKDYEYQFTQAHFLWIGSELSRRSPWLGDNLAQFDVPLFLVYLVSTVLYSLMQPKPADPQQAQQQKMMMYMMPVMFGVMMFMYKWSSAFMLYWLVLNLVSMYQSWMLNKEFGIGGKGGAAGSGGTGGQPAPAPPAAPLEPMKGVRPGNGANGRNGRGSQGKVPRGARPRGPRG